MTLELWIKTDHPATTMDVENRLTEVLTRIEGYRIEYIPILEVMRYE